MFEGNVWKSQGRQPLRWAHRRGLRAHHRDHRRVAIIKLTGRRRIWRPAGLVRARKYLPRRAPTEPAAIDPPARLLGITNPVQPAELRDDVLAPSYGVINEAVAEAL